MRCDPLMAELESVEETEADSAGTEVDSLSAALDK